jgi:fatty acid desaturase
MVTLRDPADGYKHLLAVVYALVADLAALALVVLASMSTSMSTASASIPAALAVVIAVGLAAHGRIVASYLVHECAHSSVFMEPRANQALGVLCQWLAGCPYCDFKHVRGMHLAHHKDRADTVEFDYRSFIKRLPRFLVVLILAGEWCFIPVVETIMHVRTATAPLVLSMGKSRRRSALVGSVVMLAFYGLLYSISWLAVAVHLVAGAIVLQFLAIHDCFQHTFEALLSTQNYVPGPGPRTKEYEEANTFSNVFTLRWPAVNLCSLNFGYHNAHHIKPMTPWYRLPELHAKVYKKSDSSSPQVITLADLFEPWVKHRLRRVLEDDYGTVGPAGTPRRAADFVGSLGVNFLTV